MTRKKHKSLKTRLLASLPSKFLKNKDGIAAIEFAFIAPVMLFMYFGMAEVATAISVDRQVSHSANVAGDLATQSETVSVDEMSEIMTATMMTMGIPSSKQNKVKIEISSYARASDDSIIQKGRATLNGPFPSTFDASKLDTRILSSTSGIVVARVIYGYEPLKLRYMQSDIDLKETFMLKPRKSANVDIEDNSGGTPSNNYSCVFSGGKPSCSANGNVS
ncbi:TadE/TadG family type IV pilus assembly protein [Hellea balneolensis]|uniref:TadE/TadG family type IV pilus assembly protein n=1 Tax=Hellea balneolensis TaxID=287478 RepID=UPI0003F613EF|nr:TadE/TadG family type IV pilus assembly protein [Hellea balneolensis]